MKGFDSPGILSSLRRGSGSKSPPRPRGDAVSTALRAISAHDRAGRGVQRTFELLTSLSNTLKEITHTDATLTAYLEAVAVVRGTVPHNLSVYVYMHLMFCISALHSP
jgi:hypothetical protein